MLGKFNLCFYSIVIKIFKLIHVFIYLDVIAFERYIASMFLQTWIQKE